MLEEMLVFVVNWESFWILLESIYVVLHDDNGDLIKVYEWFTLCESTFPFNSFFLPVVANYPIWNNGPREIYCLKNQPLQCLEWHSKPPGNPQDPNWHNCVRCNIMQHPQFLLWNPWLIFTVITLVILLPCPSSSSISASSTSNSAWSVLMYIVFNFNWSSTDNTCWTQFIRVDCGAWIPWVLTILRLCFQSSLASYLWRKWLQPVLMFWWTRNILCDFRWASDVLWTE